MCWQISCSSVPNHHRAIHRCDAPFDFEYNAFAFTRMSEPLKWLRHTLVGE